MKKTKVKKIKKIPRYYDGSLAVLADFPMQLSTPGLKADAGAALKTMAGKAGLAISGAMPSIANVVGSVASPIAGALGIEQGLAGQIIGSIGSAVGMVNPIAGAAIQVLGATAGGRAKANKDAVTTTNDVGSEEVVTKKSGWIGELSRDNRDDLIAQMAGIQNSKQSVEQTSHAQEQWSNDPRNQRAVLNVKNGGVVPELVHAKVSKGELYYDPYNKTLSRVPGSPNKPNTDDDVDAFLARGGMVVTNNDEQPLINGKTQAIALAPMIDKPGKKMSEGTIAARDAIVRKTVRRNEMAKLNKPENRSKTLYAAKGDIVPYSYNDDGNGGKWSDRVRNYIESVVEPAIVDYAHRATYDPYGFSGSTFVPTDRRIIGDNLEKELLKFNDSNIPVTSGTMVGTTISPDDWGWSNKSKAIVVPTSKLVGYTFTDKDLNLFDKYPWMTAPAEILNTLTVKTEGTSAQPSDKKGYSKNSGNGRSTTLPAVELDPVNIDERVKINGDRSKYVLYDPNRTDKLEFDFSKPIEVPIEGKVRTSPTFEAMLKNTNWEDFAYKAASVLTPLSDREKAEKVTSSRPTRKGIPVGVDALKQLQDAQLGYDMSNYNTTQGGYTAGQQLAARVAAADNLARQRAAIHAWQTQQQNENIAKNIASYNDHARLLSEIDNREMDMNAANRATARNINRQNRSTALNNWGKILRNKKQYAMDDVRMAALEPLLQYAYENPGQIKKLVNKINS